MNILTALILLFTLSISFASESKPDTYNEEATRVCPVSCAPTGLVKYNNKKYLFRTGLPLTWMEAVQICVNYRLRLLTLESDAEYNFIKKAVSNTFFWTSGNNLADEDKFIWQTTGAAINLTSWNPIPLNVDRLLSIDDPHCVVAGFKSSAVMPAHLQAIPCTEKHNFICETTRV